MPRLSIIIPVLNAAKNIGLLSAQIKEILSNANIDFEIIVVDGGSEDDTVKIAKAMGARVIIQAEPGFGNAFLEGLMAAAGDKILTLDADFSHPPHFILDLLRHSEDADVVIASRYVNGSKAKMPFLRSTLSRILNLLFEHGLSLPVRDNTSGFRMYKKDIFKSIDIKAKDFSIQPEIVIKAYGKGMVIKEIPFCYISGKMKKSHSQLLKVGISYLKVFLRFWKNRNSIEFADYDERGYYSWFFLQRYWQRKRYNVIMGFIEQSRSGLLADLGCGSSKIIQNLSNAMAVDIALEKLRYIRKSNKYLINATLGALPFRNQTFNCVICSEVIEHTDEKLVFEEITRILKQGGVLILGTPDYGRLQWRIIEFFYKRLLPGGYGDRHVTQYNFASLKEKLRVYGFNILGYKYICGSELIINAKRID